MPRLYAFAQLFFFIKKKIEDYDVLILPEIRVDKIRSVLHRGKQMRFWKRKQAAFYGDLPFFDINLTPAFEAGRREKVFVLLFMKKNETFHLPSLPDLAVNIRPGFYVLQIERFPITSFKLRRLSDLKILTDFNFPIRHASSLPS